MLKILQYLNSFSSQTKAGGSGMSFSEAEFPFWKAKQLFWGTMAHVASSRLRAWGYLRKKGGYTHWHQNAVCGDIAFS